jgi:hypothetical protein
MGWGGERLGLLEKGLGCTLPEVKQESGLRLAPAGLSGSIPMERLSARSARARSFAPFLMESWGRRLDGATWFASLRLIVEEALEGEVADVLGRERF